MSFNISLQYTSSPKNKIGKSITNITTLSGNLKDESSIINPVFMVDSTITELRTANYCTIGAWGRKYFITNIKTIRQGLIEIHCHVDVLDSFASEIKANNAVIKRSKSKYNMLMNDGYHKIYQNPHVVLYEFENGQAFDQYEWVLAMAGSRSNI